MGIAVNSSAGKLGSLSGDKNSRLDVIRNNVKVGLGVGTYK